MISCMGMAGGATALHQDPPTIQQSELAARLYDPRLALVNVLPRESFAGGRIPGSLSLPVPEIDDRARTVLPDPDREVAVYCGGPS
jgi:rhodanese-related sulfurtransferase